MIRIIGKFFLRLIFLFSNLPSLGASFGVAPTTATPQNTAQSSLTGLAAVSSLAPTQPFGGFGTSTASTSLIGNKTLGVGFGLTTTTTTTASNR